MNNLENLINNLVSLTDRVSTHPEYEELRLNVPGLYGKTVFDSLTSVPDMIIMEYEYLFQAKTYLKNQYKTYLKLNKSELEQHLELTLYDSANVETIYQDQLNSDELNYFIECFEGITSFIPDKYKKDICPNVVVSKDRMIAHSAFDKDSSEITITFSKDPNILAPEIIHEYGHLLEETNPSLKKVSHEFLNKRITYPKKVKMSLYCERNNIDYLPAAGNIEIYEGTFIDPYVGRVYGEKEDSSANTEVISIGLQSFFLDPVNFLFKDAEHFAIIYNLLKGNYER